MRRVSCIIGLILFVAWTSAAATYDYVPVTRETADGVISLYWLKLDATGTAVVGPTLVRQPELQVYSAEVSPSGEWVYWTEYTGPIGYHDLNSARMNTSTGVVIKGPYYELGPRFFNDGLTIASKASRLFYGEAVDQETDDNHILRARIRQNGHLANQVTQVTFGAEQHRMPAVSADGRKLYYVADPGSGRTELLYLQKLSSSGNPSGAPIQVLHLPGINIRMPRVDAKARILTYYDPSWGKVYKMRLGKNGLPTESPVEMMLTPYRVFGGITSTGRLAVFAEIEQADMIYTLKARPLDANGNVTGTTQILIEATTDHTYPWIHLF